MKKHSTREDSNIGKLLARLEAGVPVSVADGNRMGLINVSKAVTKLRDRGHRIDTVTLCTTEDNWATYYYLVDNAMQMILHLYGNRMNKD